MRKFDDATWERLTWLFITLFGVVIISRAFLAPLLRSELESNELPILPLQYRGSIFLNEEDISHGVKDFPAIFSGIHNPTSETIYARLPQVSEGSWYYFYFPIYPLVCLPLKLLFQFLSVDQERCFTVTNALMVLLSLCFVQKKLKVSAK